MIFNLIKTLRYIQTCDPKDRLKLRSIMLFPYMTALDNIILYTLTILRLCVIFVIGHFLYSGFVHLVPPVSSISSGIVYACLGLICIVTMLQLITLNIGRLWTQAYSIRYFLTHQELQRRKMQEQNNLVKRNIQVQDEKSDDPVNLMLNYIEYQDRAANQQQTDIGALNNPFTRLDELRNLIQQQDDPIKNILKNYFDKKEPPKHQ